MDDAHDTEDLDADMTVADVFVDNGKARADGLDQRGTVRVLQKPAPYAPPRFSSVVQDWDAAAQHYERMKQEEAKNKPKLPKFETIEEEHTPVSARFSRDPYSSNGSLGQSNALLRSVERDEPVPSPPRWGRESSALVPTSQEQDQTDEVAATPQGRRMESKELGESPTPIRQPVPGLAPDLIAQPESGNVDTGDQQSRSQSRSVRQTETTSPVEQRKTASSPAATLPYANAQDDIDMTDVEPEPPRAMQADPSPSVVIKNTGLQDIIENKSRAAATRKRKKSGEQLPPQKEPRLELTSSPSATRSRTKEPATGKENIEAAGTTSPVRRRERAPSFSGPQRRPSLTDHSAKPGLGLGITKSPPRKQSISKTDEKRSSRDPVSTTPLFPSSAARRLSFGQQADVTPSKAQSPGLEQVKRSAMRKDSPLERSQERRSVSFAEEAEVVTTPAIPAPRSAPRSTSRTASKADKTTPRSTPGSFGQTMVFPSNVPKEHLERIMSEAAEKVEKEELFRAEKTAEYERKIKAAEESDDHEHARLLRDILFSWKELFELEKSCKSHDSRRAGRLRQKLENKEKLLQEKEASMTVPNKASKSETNSAECPRSRTAAKSKSPATKSKLPAPKETTATIVPETLEKTQVTKTNGLSQSSLASDDVKLPTVTKVRSTEKTKRTAKVPNQTSTVAKRQITKVDVSSGDTSESEEEDKDESREGDEENPTEEATSESESVEETLAARVTSTKENDGDDKEDEEDEESPQVAKAEMIKRVRSPSQSRSGSVPLSTGSLSKSASHTFDKPTTEEDVEKPTGKSAQEPIAEPAEKSDKKPLEKPVNVSSTKTASEPSASDSASSSESESDDSDDEFIPRGRGSAPPPSTAPAALNGTSLLTNGTSPALRSSARSSLGAFPNSSQPNSAGKFNRQNLKGMLAEQKSQQAERAKKSKQRIFSNQNNRPARKDIFSPSGSSESESESESGDETGSASSGDSDRGDILPTGNATKIRKAIKRSRKT